MPIPSRPASFLVAALMAGGLCLALGAPSAKTGATPTCFDRPATIVKHAGDDKIKGTNGPDVIVAGNGQNDVDGMGGNDRICGGRDGDDIFGGQGNDKMASGAGTDFIAGEQGNDLHIGGAGDDQIDGVQKSLNSDKDRVRGSKGPDFLDVEDGEDNDRVNGGPPGMDECHYDAGDDFAACEI